MTSNKNEYEFTLSDSTTPDDVEKQLNILKKELDEEVFSSSKEFISFKYSIIIAFALISSSLIIYLSVVTDPDYILNAYEIVKLSDSYAYEEMKIEFVAINLILFLSCASLILFFIIDLSEEKESKIDYRKAERALKLFAKGKGRFLLDRHTGKHRIKVSSKSNYASKCATILIIAVASIGMIFGYGYDNNGFVREVTLEENVESIHYLNGKYTVFYRDGNKLLELKVPRNIKTEIVYDDKAEKAKIEIKYRDHEYYSYPYILPEHKRSTDYYSLITIPNNYEIQGSRKY